MSKESLKIQQDSYKKELIEEIDILEVYQERADDLNELYKKMKEKKEEMKSLQKSLDSFAYESYNYWKGNVFTNRYKNSVENQLVEVDYEKMITIIDNNLDEINNKRAHYENLVYESKGIIGKLQEGLNSIATQIKNWVN